VQIAMHHACNRVDGVRVPSWEMRILGLHVGLRPVHMMGWISEEGWRGGSVQLVRGRSCGAGRPAVVGSTRRAPPLVCHGSVC
jgi:hypothetical protein